MTENAAPRDERDWYEFVTIGSETPANRHCFSPRPMAGVMATSPPQEHCADKTCHEPRRTDSLFCHACHDALLL